MGSENLELAGQFRITPRTPSDRPGIITIGQFQLESFSDIETIAVRDDQGNILGTIIGTCIDTDARTVTRGEVVFSGDTSDTDSLIERCLYKFAGSFIFIYSWNGDSRIYLDANGSMSLVYDPVARIAGSTSATILDPADYQRRLDWPLHAALDVAHDGWLPAGLTAHQGIKRLICNHYLDLKSWRPVRHWPMTAPPQAKNVESALQIITDEVANMVAALASAGTTRLALTAGNETRVLLACCRDIVRDLGFVTVAAPGSDLDVDIAKRLSKRFGLNHEILPYRNATTEEKDLWDKRVGHSVSGMNREMHPSVMPLRGKFAVGGLGGEVGRGFLWLNATDATPVTATDIVDRLKLARHPDLVEGVEHWIAELPVRDTLLILDLAYMELRMSSWAYAQSYSNPDVNFLHPLSSRRVFEAMLSLPESMRRKDGMIFALIEKSWPDVLEVPINRYGDWRDYFSLIRNAAKNPRRVAKKIRQLARQSR